MRAISIAAASAVALLTISAHAQSQSQSPGATMPRSAPGAPCAHLREHGCELAARLRPVLCISYVCPNLARAMDGDVRRMCELVASNTLLS